MAALVACFHPVPAARYGHLRYSSEKPLAVEYPCGRCVGCQQARQRSWALRIQHEAATHSQNSFITLTYDDAHYYPSLVYGDFKRFLRRLVASLGPARYFVAGEYGSQTGRPHWHAVLFGRTFPRMSQLSGSLYRSPVLEGLWPYGFSSIGSVNPQTARYVAKYAVKSTRARAREVVHLATGEIVPIVPEFARMSLNPGLGAAWFDRYWEDVYAARDGVVFPGGSTLPPPRYYDVRLSRILPALALSKAYARSDYAYARRADSTPARLAVREVCALARQQLTKDRL